MKIRLLLLATVLTLLFAAVVPSAALAAKPTQFSATIVPTNVVLLDETPLGRSGWVLANENVSGFVLDSDCLLLVPYATGVEITARTLYKDYPNGDREGTMMGSLTFYAPAGTLELAYFARISGYGGYTFDGHWVAVNKTATGALEGIKARGTFYTDAVTGLPTIEGTYN